MKKIIKKIIRAGTYTCAVLVMIAGIGFMRMPARVLVSDPDAAWTTVQSVAAAIMIIAALVVWAFGE